METIISILNSLTPSNFLNISKSVTEKILNYLLSTPDPYCLVSCSKGLRVRVDDLFDEETGMCSKILRWEY